GFPVASASTSCTATAPRPSAAVPKPGVTLKLDSTGSTGGGALPPPPPPPQAVRASEPESVDRRTARNGWRVIASVEKKGGERGRVAAGSRRAGRWRPAARKL